METIFIGSQLVYLSVAVLLLFLQQASVVIAGGKGLMKTNSLCAYTCNVYLTVYMQAIHYYCYISP